MYMLFNNKVTYSIRVYRSLIFEMPSSVVAMATMAATVTIALTPLLAVICSNA